jgi:broad specificity phosphatase PhoE
MQYVFVRHGITGNLEQGRIQGWSAAPLSQQGRLQAQAAALRLAVNGGATALYSSPVARTLETAGIIGETLGLPVLQLPGLAERRMPSRFWGMRRLDMVDYLAEFALHTREPDWAFEDEDSLRVCVDRARSVVMFLEEHAEQPGKTVLVTHGTILRMIVATLTLGADAPLPAWADMHDALLGPQPCAFALVAPSVERLALQTWNDCAHLRGLLDPSLDPGA